LFCSLFHLTRIKIIRIQAFVRMSLPRVRYLLLQENIAFIQACVRRHQECVHSKKKLRSVLIIQKIWRGSLVRDALSTYSKSASLIRRCYSEFHPSSQSPKQNFHPPFTGQLHFILEKSVHENKAAAMIQLHFRRHREMKMLKCKRFIALSLQSFLRKKIAYKVKKISAILIQSRVRRFLLWRKLVQVNEAAARVQKFWRTFVSFFSCSNRKSPIFSLSMYHNYDDMKKYFSHVFSSSIVVQKYARRNIVVSRMKVFSASAIRIQHFWYLSVASKNSCIHALKYSHSPKIISFMSLYGFSNAKHYKHEIYSLTILETTIKLQTAFRSRKFQREFHEREVFGSINFAPQKVCADLVQSCSESQSVHDIESLQMIEVQKTIHGRSSRQIHSAITPVTILQTATEICSRRDPSRRENFQHQCSWDEAQNSRPLLDDENSSFLHFPAVCIQKIVRRYLIKRNNNMLSCSALSIQTWWRKVTSGLSIQTAVKYHKYYAILHSVTTMQKRCKHLSTTSRSKFLKKLDTVDYHRPCQNIFGEKPRISKSTNRNAPYNTNTSNMTSSALNSTCTIPTACVQKNPCCVEFVGDIMPPYKDNSYAFPIHDIKPSLNSDSCQPNDKKEDFAFTSLQGIWRGSRIRRNLRKASYASVVIQNVWASYRAKCAHCQQERLKTTVKIIQRLVRSYVTKRLLRKRVQAATKIQLVIRAKKLLQTNLALNRIVTILQSYARMRVLTKSRDHVFRNVITIQSFFRTILAQNLRRLLTSKSPLTERSWVLYEPTKKMASLPIFFHDVTNRVVALQNALRKSLASRSKAAKIIQLAFFSWKMKSTLRQVIQSVIRIQCAVRGSLVRRQIKSIRFCIQTEESSHQALCEILPTRFDDIKSHASIRIQSTFRCYRQMKKAEGKKIVVLALEYLYIARKLRFSLISAVVTIQKYVRRYLIRLNLWQKMVASASKIQSAFRSSLHHINHPRIQETTTYDCMIKGIVESQTLFRGQREREMFNRLRLNCIVIQKFARMFLFCSLFHLTRIKIIRIQAFVRMSLPRVRYLLLQENIAFIQACVRRHQECVHSKKKLRSVLIIQKIWRGSLVRDALSTYSKSASLIRRCYSEFHPSSQSPKQNFHPPFTGQLHFILEKSVHENKAAAMIQLHFRRHREMKMLKCKRFIALSLQSFLRKKIAYKVKKISAILIQSRVRRFLLWRKLVQVNEAAAKIQKAWMKCVILLRKELLHALKIVSFPVRSSPFFHSSHKARILLPKDPQGLKRMKFIAHQLPRSHECGIFIETVLNSVAVVIQSFSRRYLARSECRRWQVSLDVGSTKKLVRKSTQSVNNLDKPSSNTRSPNYCQKLYEYGDKEEASSIILQRFFRTRIIHKSATSNSEYKTKTPNNDIPLFPWPDEKQNTSLHTGLSFPTRFPSFDENEAHVLGEVYKRAEYIADGIIDGTLSLEISPCVVHYVEIAKSVLERFPNKGSR